MLALFIHNANIWVSLCIMFLSFSILRDTECTIMLNGTFPTQGLSKPVSMEFSSIKFSIFIDNIILLLSKHFHQDPQNSSVLVTYRENIHHKHDRQDTSEFLCLLVLHLEILHHKHHQGPSELLCLLVFHC